MHFPSLLPLLSLLSVSAASPITPPLPPPKTLTTTSNHTYSYHYVPAHSPKKPTYLLLHGFPSAASDWAHQIADLTAAGFGVLAPDLLGYGGTSKPADPEEYRLSVMSRDLTEVLDKEGLKSVVGVGHDWGAGLLGKFVNYHPEYFSSLVFLSVPYAPGPFELDVLNKEGEERHGYSIIGYMYWFNSTSAAATIEAHIPSFLDLVYPADPFLWRTDFCPIDRAEAFISSNTRTGLPTWEPRRERLARLASFRKGGLTGPLNWYKAAIRNLDADAIATIPEENLVIKVPTLFVGGDRDYATRSDDMEGAAEALSKQGLLKDVRVEVLKGSGHWVMLEEREKVSGLLKGVGEALKKRE